MKNDVIQDAKNLAEKILKSLDPDEKWVIVNIASDKFGNDIVLDNNYSSIPETFGYIHDKTPGFLERHRVIEGKTVGWWYVGVAWIKGHWGNVRPDDLGIDDNITDIAQKKGYISKDKIIKYYYVPTDDIGPQLDGGMAILVNKQKLKKFLVLCGSLKVNFNEVEQSLEFLGENVPFEGKLEAERVKLLIDNINKVVTSDDFIKVQYKFPKSNVIDSDIEENSRKMFKRIRNKIKRNEVLKNALTLKESKGYCMKIEEEFVETFLSSSK